MDINIMTSHLLRWRWWFYVYFRFKRKHNFVKITVFMVWFLLDFILECILLINGIKTIGYICCFKLILVLHSCNACSAGNNIIWLINFAGETGSFFLAILYRKKHVIKRIWLSLSFKGTRSQIGTKYKFSQ